MSITKLLVKTTILLIFFTHTVFAELQPGIDFCISNPSVCGLYASCNSCCSTCPADLSGQLATCQSELRTCYQDGSTQQGIAQCQSNPTSCGIQINQNTDGSTQEGIAQCQNNPASCGIWINQNTDGSTDAGVSDVFQAIQTCTVNFTDPNDMRIDCRVNSTSNNNQTLADVLKKWWKQHLEICQQEPSKCGIYSQPSEMTIEKCKNEYHLVDPKECTKEDTSQCGGLKPSDTHSLSGLCNFSIDNQGIKDSRNGTKFAGGSMIVGSQGEFAVETKIVPSQSINLEANIEVATEDVGKQADLLLVEGRELQPPYDGGTDTQYYSYDKDSTDYFVDLYANSKDWMAGLTRPFRENITLQANILIDWTKRFDVGPATHYFFVGYRLKDDSGIIVYNQQPIKVIVQDNTVN